MVVEKKDLDWSSLGFSYIKTDYRFRARWREGVWQPGELVESEVMEVHEGSPVLHYAQACFEGLKAQSSPDDKILLFRPELNCQRMAQTADRLVMPEVPEALFMQGITECIRANKAWVPPSGSGASLYVRPFLIGVGENLGLRPAPEYEFRVFVCPVGPYYKSGGLSLISLAVTDVDRAAPKGTGRFKAGANYAGGLMATQLANQLGANEALYLDAGERRYLEEAGSANIFLVMKNGKFVVPESPSILPGVTRRSVITLAEDRLGLEVQRRPVDLRNEIEDIDEFGACGTAAVISPVGKVFVDEQWHHFYGGGEAIGPTTQKLYDMLTRLQRGERDDPYGWTVEV